MCRNVLWCVTGVGVPGLYQGGLVPGKGQTLSTPVGDDSDRHNQTLSVYLRVQTSRILTMSPLGFGGRGVLPGVATGTDLNQKSSECFHTFLYVLEHF